MALNKTTAAALARAWANFYHAASTHDIEHVKKWAAELKSQQIDTGVTLWDDDMIDLKVMEITAPHQLRESEDE